MFGRNKNTLLAALDDWQKRELISSDLAEKLRLDVLSHAKKFSFTAVIVLLGVICLAFAVMTFVAANWDVMSNLQRVGILFIGLWFSWGLSIYFNYREQNWLAQVFVLLSCAIFGASIMLIAQIYHMQGEPEDATWLWAIGTIFAALITRSTPALCLGIILLFIWSSMGASLFYGIKDTDYTYLIYWAICAAGAWWLSSRLAAHLLALSLIYWIYANSFLKGYNQDTDLYLAIASICLALIIFAITLLSYRGKNWFKEFEPSILRYDIFFIGLMLMTTFVVMRFDENNSSTPVLPYILACTFVTTIMLLASTFYAYKNNLNNKYDNFVLSIFSIICFVILLTPILKIPYVAEAYLLAFSIWIIRLGWRLEIQSISILGYLGFGWVMFFLYANHQTKLLNTSVFFFGIAILLLVGAFILPKIIGNKHNKGKNHEVS